MAPATACPTSSMQPAAHLGTGGVAAGARRRRAVPAVARGRWRDGAHAVHDGRRRVGAPAQVGRPRGRPSAVVRRRRGRAADRRGRGALRMARKRESDSTLALVNLRHFHVPAPRQPSCESENCTAYRHQTPAARSSPTHLGRRRAVALLVLLVRRRRQGLLRRGSLGRRGRAVLLDRRRGRGRGLLLLLLWLGIGALEVLRWERRGTAGMLLKSEREQAAGVRAQAQAKCPRQSLPWKADNSAIALEIHAYVRKGPPCTHRLRRHRGRRRQLLGRQRRGRGGGRRLLRRKLRRSILRLLGRRRLGQRGSHLLRRWQLHNRGHGRLLRRCCCGRRGVCRGLLLLRWRLLRHGHSGRCRRGWRSDGRRRRRARRGSRRHSHGCQLGWGRGRGRRRRRAGGRRRCRGGRGQRRSGRGLCSLGRGALRHRLAAGTAGRGELGQLCGGLRQLLLHQRA